MRRKIIIFNWFEIRTWISTIAERRISSSMHLVGLTFELHFRPRTHQQSQSPIANRTACFPTRWVLIRYNNNSGNIYAIQLRQYVLIGDKMGKKMKWTWDRVRLADSLRLINNNFHIYTIRATIWKNRIFFIFGRSDCGAGLQRRRRVGMHMAHALFHIYARSAASSSNYRRIVNR